MNEFNFFISMLLCEIVAQIFILDFKKPEYMFISTWKALMCLLTQEIIRYKKEPIRLTWSPNIESDNINLNLEILFMLDEVAIKNILIIIAIEMFFLRYMYSVLKRKYQKNRQGSKIFASFRLSCFFIILSLSIIGKCSTFLLLFGLINFYRCLYHLYYL